MNHPSSVTAALDQAQRARVNVLFLRVRIARTFLSTALKRRPVDQRSGAIAKADVIYRAIKERLEQGVNCTPAEHVELLTELQALRDELAALREDL